MANIISSIHLCKVPITAKHQIDFETIAEQQAYFLSKKKHSYEKCRYQARTSTIKVKGYVDSLQDCNYVYYTNTYNGVSKTFYAWIVAKDYIAKEVCSLTIQIDVFQTWLFDVNFSPCMIEREHVTDDTIGSHTIKEDFELGDYITATKKSVSCLEGNPCFFIGLTDTASGTIGGIFGKTYSGFIVKYYEYSDINLLNTLITNLCNDGKADSIAFIFTFPKKLLNMTALVSGNGVSGYEGICHSDETFSWTEMKHYFLNNDNTIFTPFNNKLFCYPFNFITVKNSNGGNVVLKIENFNNINDIEFRVDSVLTQNPNISLTPILYCGKSFAIDDSITMQDFGLCSWNNDNYANWWATNRNSVNAQSANATSSVIAQRKVASNNYNNANENRNTNAEKGAINTALSTLNALGSLNFLGGVSNAVGGGANTYLDYQQAGKNANNDLANTNLMNNTNYENEIRSIVASVSDAQVQPNTSKGSTASCGLDLARGTATFFLEQTSIKGEYAKIIDSFFQMFGYQVNSVKSIDFKTRSKWNYIKSVNCNSYGNIPQEDVNAINSLFDNGLTVWHDETYMYNYDIANSVKEVLG